MRPCPARPLAMRHATRRSVYWSIGGRRRADPRGEEQPCIEDWIISVARLSRPSRARRTGPRHGGCFCGGRMNQWSATPARRVLAALLRMGWQIKRHAGGSHRIRARPHWPDVVFAFHSTSIPMLPRMLCQ